MYDSPILINKIKIMKNIFYSEKYQDNARIVAKQILIERGKQEIISDRQNFNNFSLYVLLEKYDF